MQQRRSVDSRRLRPAQRWACSMQWQIWIRPRTALKEARVAIITVRRRKRLCRTTPGHDIAPDAAAPRGDPALQPRRSPRRPTPVRNASLYNPVHGDGRSRGIEDQDPAANRLLGRACPTRCDVRRRRRRPRRTRSGPPRFPAPGGRDSSENRASWLSAAWRHRESERAHSSMKTKVCPSGGVGFTMTILPHNASVFATKPVAPVIRDVYCSARLLVFRLVIHG